MLQNVHGNWIAIELFVFVVTKASALVVIVNAVYGMQELNSRREIWKKTRNSDDPDEGIKYYNETTL